MKFLQKISGILTICLIGLRVLAGPISADLVVLEPTCRPDQDPDANYCVESGLKSIISVNEDLTLIYAVSGVVVLGAVAVSAVSLRRLSQKTCTS